MVAMVTPITPALDSTVRGGNVHSPTKPGFRPVSSSPTYHLVNLGFPKTAKHAALSMPRDSHVAPSLTAASTKFSTGTSDKQMTVDATSSPRKKGLRRRLGMGALGSLFKLRPMRRPRKSLSEPQLQRRVERLAQWGDWDAVRKLVAGYEFPSTAQDPASVRDSFAPENLLQEDGRARRRSSYRSGGRRSFSAGESTAAAAVIRAALFEESQSSSDDEVNAGENILHELCRHNPPLDVLELLVNRMSHRKRGCTTSGVDHNGQTPLHVAAMAGASPEIIDALVRADQNPASSADRDGRSPLHLVMKSLVSKKEEQSFHPLARLHHHHVLSPAEELDRTYLIVRILKEAMLTHPGKVDFKDEDVDGLSPLDYAIDGDIDNDELINALLRRRERRKTPQRPSGITLSNRRRMLAAQSSLSDDQDLDVLHQLEQEELEARRQRLVKMRARRERTARKERVNDALFDVFGIDEPQTLADEPVPVQTDEPHSEPEPQPAMPRVMSDEDIYNKHLLDYFEDAIEGLAGCEKLALADDDGFDIFEDPGQDPDPECAFSEDEAGPASVVAFAWDDDCSSMVSELTVLLAK